MARDTRHNTSILDAASSIEDLVACTRPLCENQVNSRIEEFLTFPRNDLGRLFSELSFCVLTANWQAKGGMRAQEAIGDGFLTLPPSELVRELKSVGHRFAAQRANFILHNRLFVGMLPDILGLPLRDARLALVKTFKGIGWKEASHFLRNVGFLDVAILDKHILRLMARFGLTTEIPKSWSRLRYETTENLLRPIAKKLQMPLGVLDLYLWYAVKGTVDK
ncbi:N-glycosylase/DNA lyase [Coprothermobacteraceae bacterium]|nr:N-glycosylase/DNA lyase [Coprothermobacteraceae bacterium]